MKHFFEWAFSDMDSGVAALWLYDQYAKSISEGKEQ